MIPLGLGALVLVGLWWLGRQNAPPSRALLVKHARRAGGWLALAVAAVMLLRGRLDMATVLGFVGAWLLGTHRPTLPFGLDALLPGGPPAGAARLRSAMIEMEIDPRSGALRGTVLAGRLAGRALDDLPPAALSELLATCRAGDPEGARFLEAYLDRRMPGWREHAEGHPDPRAGAAPQPGSMTEEEAYQVLGLERGAPVDDVRRAHRTLMKRLHPDQGGSGYLAARVNAAKDRLLNRHR
ncbi:molecular chaperone DnaJ [Methylobacterium oryzihabitans]|uniref:molecular chaperone DnaJ n=1 Tax=Methylobacterium oryzihabitans TaxID=2499852 RepID=UPI0016523021|nr:molecular chaperone DnaJ [Methylobacterium oryzihabitans]